MGRVPSRYYTEPPYKATKTITFTGAANMGAAGDNVSIFTVTGEVMIAFMVPFCTTLLDEAAGGATISLGVTNSVALFIAATASVDIDADEFWVDNAPDPYGVALPAGLQNIVITDDIVAACAVQDTDAGVIRFDCFWRPLSSDGKVVAA